MKAITLRIIVETDGSSDAITARQLEDEIRANLEWDAAEFGILAVEVEEIVNADVQAL